MPAQIKTELSFNGLTALYQIAHFLASGQDLEVIMTKILEILENNVGMSRGMITILSPNNEELAVDVARGISESDKKKASIVLEKG